MSDIFISYSREDREQAKRLAEKLTEIGWTVWWDKKIPAGKTFADVIEKMLRDVKCVLVLWSGFSVKSRYVHLEANKGLERGILIPVLIEDITVPFIFSDIQAANLINWNGDIFVPEFQDFIKDISEMLGSPPKTQENEGDQADNVIHQKSETEERKRVEVIQRKQQEGEKFGIEDEKKKKPKEERLKAEENNKLEERIKTEAEKVRRQEEKAKKLEEKRKYEVEEQQKKAEIIKYKEEERVTREQIEIKSRQEEEPKQQKDQLEIERKGDKHIKIGLEGSESIDKDEDDLWQAVLGEKTIAFYRSYLAKYPNGRFAMKAKKLVSVKLFQKTSIIVSFSVVGLICLIMVIIAVSRSNKNKKAFNELVQRGTELFGSGEEYYLEAKSVFEQASWYEINEYEISERIYEIEQAIETTFQNHIINFNVMIKAEHGDLAKLILEKAAKLKPSNDQIEGLWREVNKISNEPIMILVEGGEFQMGSEFGNNDEQPQHLVKLDSYYISKFEITQRQWLKMTGNNPSNNQNCDSCPVESVTWYEIQSFIRKLNEETTKKYRLPTEAEWEYAARGGNKSQGYTYSGSDSIDRVAFYVNNSNDQTHPVGLKVSNELNIYDMSGNVQELCNDWYDIEYYGISPEFNPIGPSTGTNRVSRGGSFSWMDIHCNTRYRNEILPDTKWSNVGFRLVLEN